MPRARLKTARRPSSAPRTSGRRQRAGAAEQDGRERILAAAIRTFSELGYAGATTAGIARAAGVTQPLVHHHFGSKDGLWRAAVDAVFADMPRVAAIAGGAMPREALAAILEQFVRFVAAHPEATRITAREGAAPSPRLDYLLQRYLHEAFREVVDVIRAAQAAGIVAPEVRAEIVLFLLLGAGSHLFDVSALAQRSQGIDTTSAWTRDALVASMHTLVRHGLFRPTRDPNA